MVTNEYSYAIFNELTNELDRNQKHWLFNNDIIARTFPQIDNDFSRKATLKLLHSGYKWSGEAFDSASQLKNENEYKAFLEHMENNKENQD